MSFGVGCQRFIGTSAQGGRTQTILKAEVAQREWPIALYAADGGSERVV